MRCLLMKACGGNMPIIVYGYDEAADQVWIADRANVPLTVATDELLSARARIKKDKFRLMTLDMPDHDKLSAAVSAGIWDCIKLFTEKPPKGSVKNFGLAAYQNWITLLNQAQAAAKLGERVSGRCEAIRGVDVGF